MHNITNKLNTCFAFFFWTIKDSSRLLPRILSKATENHAKKPVLDFLFAIHNMLCNYLLNETRYKLPNTLITKFEFEICDKNGKFTRETFTNHQRFVEITINRCVKSIRFIPEGTNGCREYRIFSLYVE